MSDFLPFCLALPKSGDLGQVPLRPGSPEAAFAVTGNEPIFDQMSADAV